MLHFTKKTSIELDSISTGGLEYCFMSQMRVLGSNYWKAPTRGLTTIRKSLPLHGVPVPSRVH